MLAKIIDICGRRKFLTLSIVFGLVFAGWKSLEQIPLDAIPDLSDTQVIVYTTWNVSPDIIEDQVTYPIVTSLLSVPKVKDIRGLSVFGASYVYAIFEDGTDIYWARSRIMEYLANITPQLPPQAKVQLGPDATGVGWVFQYALKDTTGKTSLDEMRSFQDWFLRYQIQAVPGVAEVASFGGFEKQYQVQVNPELLRTYGISLRHVNKSIQEGNSETGARVVEFSGIEYMVRVRGYAKTLQDIEDIVIGADKSGTPIYVKNVAQVVEGPEIRRGVGDLNGEGDAVGGIVIMRYGENANAVIKRVKERLEELKGSFPPGVELVTTYDRSDLIQKAIATLKSKVVLEMLVVAFVIFLFLLHFTSSLVPIFVLPAAVVVSFIPMYFMGISLNIMSLGGIIISIGAMVDAAIVVVENCHKKLEEWRASGEQGDIKNIILEAIKEVGPASFYSLLVIAVSFLPIFVLEQQEGKLFKPLAYTKTLAMMVAAFMSVTFVPAVLTLMTAIKEFNFKPLWLSRMLNKVLSPHSFKEEDHPISKILFKLYGPIVDFVVIHRWKTVFVAILMVAATVPVYFKLGSEFMPPLNEGTILYMPTTMPGISVTEAQELLQKQGEILKSFPEVKSVHGKAGRASTATDPAPLSMMETVVVLKDQSQWRSKERWYSDLPGFLKAPFEVFLPEHLTWEELIRDMNSKMKFPGLTNAWTLPIKGRIDMLTTGIRTPVGIKILGSDLHVIAKTGEDIEKLLQDLPGTRSVFSERVTGGYFLDIDFDRTALARHDISVELAQKEIQSALGGMNISTTVEGRERYPIQVRYARGFRREIEDIEKITIYSPKGYHLPLGSVAQLSFKNGPGMIRNENGLLAGYVFVDLDTDDIGTYVKKAKSLLSEKLEIKPGYSLTWSGQYESLSRVREKLKVVLPITLIIVLLLIYLNTKSAIKTSIVLLAIPFSAIGAVWLLYVLGFNMSIAVWVGIIALLGVDAETAIYMLLYLDLSYEKKKSLGQMNSRGDLYHAIHEGAVKRIRPKMMTVMTTFVGLLPVLLASTSSTGADVMKRMAAPMVGGIFTSFLLELLVYPAIFAIWKEREILKSGEQDG